MNDDSILISQMSEETPLLPDKVVPIQGGCRQLKAVAAACMGSLSLGLVLGYSSPALPQLIEQGRLTTTQGTWYGSLVTLGAMIGGPFGGILADAMGRKTSILLNAVPYTVGWLLNLLTDDVWLMYLGRLLTGLAVGISSLCVPVYIAEVSAPGLRGRFGSCFQVCIASGILITYVLGLYVSWQWLTVACALVPAAMVVAMLAVPESPRWLLRHGRRQDAVSALVWLRKAKSEREISREWVEIDGGLDFGKTDTKTNLKNLLRPTLYKPFLLSVFLMVIQQFSGINAVIFYTNTIFQSSGFQGNSGMPTVIIGSLMVVFTIGSVFAVDKAGRRMMLIISGVFMAFSSALLGLYYYMDSASLRWLSLFSLAVYIAAFSLGWGPLPWVVISELLPPQGYGLTSGIATATNWTIAFIVTKEFAAMQEALTQYGTFWLFGVVCFLGALCTGIFLPETKGKSLQDITMFFES